MTNFDEFCGTGTKRAEMYLTARLKCIKKITKFFGQEWVCPTRDRMPIGRTRYGLNQLFLCWVQEVSVNITTQEKD
jgi:hypothetical protein